MAGNITGEGFAKEIINQIKARQKVYGASNRSTDQLRYLNGKNPWIKLTSANNIDTSILTASNVGLPANYSATGLADNYILFGGSALNTGTKLRGGLEETYNIEGSAKNYGYRPMSGITSIESKNRNRGSVRETNINIKAYNTTQFNIIDLLYLRLGYTVLLEWGHSVYIDNNGVVKDFIATDTLASNFINGEYNDNHQKLIEDINKKKLFYSGNYDAIYGKVSNFSWTYETDGSYTITLTVLSLGEIIESLKVNTIPKDTKEAQEAAKEAESATEENDVVYYMRNRDKISNLLYNTAKALYQNPNNRLSDSGLQPFKSGTLLSTFPEDVAKSVGLQNEWDAFALVETTGINEDRYFIRLGAFLRWLEENQILYSKTSSIFKIDYDEETNLIFTTPYVLSSDPRICVVKTTIEMSDENIEVFGDLGYDFKTTIDDVVYGKLMNIYINSAFIIKKIDEVKDENGDTSLFSILEAICEGINTSLGHVNKLAPCIDEEDNNRVYLIDETPLPNRDALLTNKGKETETAIFQIYGYKENNSSFITNFGIKTEITNELSSMITIGAQANGSVKGTDATAFSKWNEGIVDRIISVKTDTSGSTDTKQSFEGDTNTQYENITAEYSKFVNGFQNISANGVVYDDQVDYFDGILKNFLNYIQTKDSLDNSKISPNSVGFIPLSLNLDMIGLSGMKIYQKYTIDQNFLPSRYPECVEFLIKGISQKVDEKGWYTSIESLSIPKNDLLSKGANPSLTFITPPVTSTENGDPSGTPSGGTTGTGPAGTPGSLPCPLGVCDKSQKLSNTSPPGYTTDSKSITARMEAIKTMSLSANPFRVNYQLGKPAGKDAHLCAGYTYNHAYNFAQAIKGKPVQTGNLQSTGGNANQAGFYAKLVALGYQQITVGKYLTHSEAVTLTNSIKYNIGDVLVYYNTVGEQMHAQFYVGNPSTWKGKDGKPFSWTISGNRTTYGYGEFKSRTVNVPSVGVGDSNPKGWVTDNANNFGTSFVYGNSPNACYCVILFRAPGDSSEQSARELVIYNQYLDELNKIYTLKDGNVYRKAASGQDTGLLADLKGVNDNEDSAVTRTRQLFGTIPKPVNFAVPSWYNKLPLSQLGSLQAHFKAKLEEFLKDVESATSQDYLWKLPDINNPSKDDSKLTPKTIQSNF